MSAVGPTVITSLKRDVQHASCHEITSEKSGSLANWNEITPIDSGITAIAAK